VGVAPTEDPRLSRRTYLYRGTARHELGRHAEALADFEQSLELRPQRNAAAHWMIALAALQLGQGEQARKHQEQAGREDPDDFRSLVAQALALAHEERGLTLMDRAIEREPFDPTLYFYRGRIAANLTFRQGESRFYERAVDDLEKALLARPGDPKILTPLCDVLLNATRLGDLTGWARAKGRTARLLEAWRKAHPDDTDALRLLMENDLQHGEFRHCAELAREGQRLAPNDAVFPLHLAWAYVQLNDQETAEKCYDRAIELQPTLVALTGRAVCRGHHRDDDAKSIRELEELRRRYPPATWTYGDFGAFWLSYTLCQDTRGVLSVCDDYLRVVPGSSQGHHRRAWALCGVGDRAKAEAAFARALELNPSDWHIYQERAWMVYEASGQHDKALADVDRYLASPSARPRDGRFSPDQIAKLAEAVGGRGAILDRLGRQAEGERDHRECMALRLKIEGEGLTEAVIENGDWDLVSHYGQLGGYVSWFCRRAEAPAVFRAIRPEPPRHARAHAAAKLGQLFAVLAPRLAAAGAQADQERAWRQAAELFRRAAEDAGEASPGWQRDRARCLAALAALLRDSGRKPEADELDRAARDAARRWRQWVEALPEPSPDAMHDAVGARGTQFFELALFPAAEGTREDQERAWTRAAALFRRASETSGPVSRWDRMRARCHAELAALMRTAGRGREADEQDRAAAEAARRWRERAEHFLAEHPDNTGELDNIAWLLATWPVPALRDPARAVELARKAVGRNPNQWDYRLTLGVALYRNGDLDGAAEALGKARAAGGRDDTRVPLALAMTQWQRGRRAEARALYDEAAKALRAAGPDVPDEPARLLREASNLLGQGPAPTGHAPPPAGPEVPPG
jgi:tetratricopeptide (TPR) repeat protein